MLNKFINWVRGREEPAGKGNPSMDFGRYSDNNKQSGKVRRWKDADQLFKEKKYAASVDAFFDYLKDDVAGNVLIYAMTTRYASSFTRDPRSFAGK